jgi:hypothetical protein
MEVSKCVSEASRCARARAGMQGLRCACEFPRSFRRALYLTRGTPAWHAIGICTSPDRPFMPRAVARNRNGTRVRCLAVARRQRSGYSSSAMRCGFCATRCVNLNRPRPFARTPVACMRAVARPASSVAQPLPLLQRAHSVSVTDDERAVFTAMLRAEQAWHTSHCCCKDACCPLSNTRARTHPHTLARMQKRARTCAGAGGIPGSHLRARRGQNPPR